MQPGGKFIHLPLRLCIFSHDRRDARGSGTGTPCVDTQRLWEKIPLRPHGEPAASHTQPPVSPAKCYPEILQGPERTNVKRAHVTHFYSKNIIADHPNFLRPSKYLAKLLERRERSQSNGREAAAVSVGVGFCGERCKLSSKSASVKMALANDWKTARRNGSGR